MIRQRPHQRTPAHAQPINGRRDAVSVFSRAASEPARPQTIALLLDQELIPRTCIVVDETTDPDDVMEVARLVVEVVEQEIAIQAVALASIRVHAVGADQPAGASLDERERDDVDRWLELLELFDEVGVEVLDWYVLLDGRAESLRGLAGMPSLWPDGS
jgi:hypothetical protein